MATTREAGVELPQDHSAVAYWLRQVEFVDEVGETARPELDVGIHGDKLAFASSVDADTNRSSCLSNSETDSSFS